MEIILSVIGGVVVIGVIALLLIEYRIRQPDFLVLYESKSQIKLRKGLVYPRHFSLSLKRTTYPIQLTIEATAVGNLGIRVKLVGSVAPSLEHLPSLIRVGGWNLDAVARSTDEVQVLLQELVKEYAERSAINELSTTGWQLTKGASSMKYGQMIAGSILDPTDPNRRCFRQQEQAHLLNRPA
jgi:hypothetical protein